MGSLIIFVAALYTCIYNCNA